MAALDLAVALVVAMGFATFTTGPLCLAAAVGGQRAAPGDEACTTYLCEHGYYIDMGCRCLVSSISADHAVATALSHPCNATQNARAIAEFQKARGLMVTSACDTATRRAMRNRRTSDMANDGFFEAPSSRPSSTSVGAGPDHSSGANETAAAPRSILRKKRQAAAPNSAARRFASVPASSPTDGGSLRLVEAPGRLLRPAVGRGAATASAAADDDRQQRSASSSAEAAAGLFASPASSAAAAPVSAIFETGTEGLQRYWAEIRQQYAGSSPGNSSDAASGAANRRHKRGTVINGGAFTFAKTSLKWRIISYSGTLAQADQNAAMDAAFRQWAAVTPLCFANDQTSDISTIDIVLGFYAGSHAGDAVAFDGPGGALAHTNMGQFTHFDSTESWYTGTTAQTGVALSAVALHEFGHVIGLTHSATSTAIMYSSYPSSSPNTVLTDADRSAALAKYGPCSGTFDAAVDVQFNSLSYDDLGNPVTTRYFSTYFFRNSYNWLYINSLGRPADYEPQLISSYWSGVPNQLDAAFQYSGGGVDQLFFLKGSTVYLYSYSTAPVGVTASYAISTFFPAGSIGEPIPNNVDSAYFDPRDGNIYFIKGSLVYVYRYVPTGPHSCCVAKRNVSDLFPIAPGQPATVGGVTYQQNAMAYRSVSNNSLYFFAGNQVWKNQNFNASSNVISNSMVYLGTWNSYWNYICDVVC